jgi:hypothetical protein
MSVSKPWKALERRHAKRMPNGVRLWRPDFGESMPDGESPTDTWDAKCYKRFSVVELFVRCELKYRRFTGDRRFHLVLFSRDHPRAGDFVLLRASDYAELVAAQRLAAPASSFVGCDKQVATREGSAVGLCGLKAGHDGPCCRVGIDFPA